MLWVCGVEGFWTLLGILVHGVKKRGERVFWILMCIWVLPSLRISSGSARGVMVIVAGYGHGDTSSIPGQD